MSLLGWFRIIGMVSFDIGSSSSNMSLSSLFLKVIFKGRGRKGVLKGMDGIIINIMEK